MKTSEREASCCGGACRVRRLALTLALLAAPVQGAELVGQLEQYRGGTTITNYNRA